MPFCQLVHFICRYCNFFLNLVLDWNNLFVPKIPDFFFMNLTTDSFAFFSDRKPKLFWISKRTTYARKKKNFLRFYLVLFDLHSFCDASNHWVKIKNIRIWILPLCVQVIIPKVFTRLDNFASLWSLSKSLENKHWLIWGLPEENSLWNLISFGPCWRLGDFIWNMHNSSLQSHYRGRGLA